MKKKSATQSAFFNLRLLIGLLVVCTGIFLALVGSGMFSNVFAAQDKKPAPQKPSGDLDKSGVRVISPYNTDVSRPLRDAVTVWPPAGKSGEPHEANPNPMMPHRHVDGADTVIQKNFFQKYVQPYIPGPILNFDGVPFPGVSCNCAPPDTNGAVGKNHFMQMVNEGYQVFDKTTGASVLGPNSIVSVWAGFGGACQTGGFGDPVVMYDKLADRWIITEFASATGGAPITDECVAVSATGDPTGVYYRYGYHLGSNFFDYPHLGVWPDAYYMAMNVFNSGGTAFLGVQPFAFDRSKMLVGDPTATVVTTGFAPLGVNEEYFLPADLDGVIAPPAGAPNPFVEWPGAGSYRVYLFHADFVTPANSTFTLLASPAAAAFTQLCSGNRACVPEPNADHIDAIADRLMHRSAYRKFPDGHDALVSNYTVSANAVAGVRWFEMRNPLVTPVVFQESTYQPDTTWRFMGSVAQDNQGNMALGFTVSSATVFPGLSYAGRLAGDPINTLAQGEAVLFTGVGSQSGTNNRWGDYSAMTLDPVDDCTFWYTNEYYPAGSATFNWRTRVGNFKFTQCTAPAKGTAHFVVTFCQGGGALTNAAISIDGNLYGSSLSTGFYDAPLAPGAHTYSVSKPTFGTVTGNFNITDGQVTNVPVCLVGTPVISSAGSTLAAEGCQPPNGVIDPSETVTVTFKLMNTGGASTANLVATLQNSGGVTPITTSQNYGVINPGDMAARDFAFTASGSCGGSITATLQLQDGATNLGNVTFTYTLGVQILTLSENFDGVTPPALPAGWTADVGINTAGAPLWQTSNSGTPTPVADSAPNAAFTQDPANLCDNRIYTPVFMYTGPATMSCRMNYDLEQSSTTVAFDAGVLEISINGAAYADIVTAGGSFVTGGYNHTSISTGFANPLLPSRPNWSGVSGGFVTTTVNLPASGIGQSVQLRWRMGSDSSVTHAGWRVDSVAISGGYVCCVGAPTPQSAGSRKTHGANDFDVNLPLTGTTGVEDRSGGATNDFTMVVTFASPVTVNGAPQAQVTLGTGTVGSGGVSNGGAVTISGNVVTVPLTNVANAQTINVTLNNVNGLGNVVIPMSRLLGDTNANRTVNASDVGQTKNRIGQLVDGTNFRSDVNVTNTINAGDVGLIKQAIGTSVP